MDINSLLNSLNQDDWMNHLYEILDCVPASTPEQISAEYKHRVLECHPDKNKKNSDDSEEFKRLTTAYKTLKDLTERAQYDRWRTSGIKVPWRKWKELGAYHQSVHWQSLPPIQSITAPESTSSSQEAGQDDKVVFLPSSSSSSSSPSTINQDLNLSTPWKSASWRKKEPSDDLYSKFRNYEV